MSQDYEYECMRAELLGLPKPEKRPEPVKQPLDAEDDVDEIDAVDAVDAVDEIDAETAKEMNDIKDSIKKLGGGFEEINSILTVTQKKINTFKSNFGSLKDLFQRHLSTDNGSGGESASTSSEAKVEDEPSGEVKGTPGMTKKLPGTSKVAKDLNQEMESQVDKLDALVTKAEHAEMSMSSQNKQMRTFLN